MFNRIRPLYYPSSGSASGTEFTVINMDAEELRKSQRKKRAPQIVIQPAATGNYDSDDDDDDVRLALNWKTLTTKFTRRLPLPAGKTRTETRCRFFRSVLSRSIN